MYTDELKLQIATILNLLAIIASVVALFATKQMPAHIRVFVFVICIMALGTISACDLLSALLIGEGQMAVGIIVSLMSIALSIYMLIHIWGERVAIMGHFKITSGNSRQFNCRDESEPASSTVTQCFTYNKLYK